MNYDKYIFLRNPFRYIPALWNKMAVIQKIIFMVIILAVIGFFVMLVSLSLSTSPYNMVAVKYTSIMDEDARNRIITRINEEGYKTSVDAYGTIMAKDTVIALKIQNILIQEDLIPKGINRFNIFDIDYHWFISDYERNFIFLEARTQFARLHTELVKDHIKVFAGVDDAYVSIVFPKEWLFQEDQKDQEYQYPVRASVIITPIPGSDITKNRKKIEGIQKILKYAVEGLKDENIIITDQNGLVLNDFGSE